MADQDNSHYDFLEDAEEEPSIISTRGLEAFGRKVTTTASHLMAPNPEATAHHYQTAMAQVHRQLTRPSVQRSVFAMARRTPSEIVRSKLSTAEIQHRAVSFLPDDLLSNIPEDDNSFSLFQGFQASFPEMTDDGKKHRRRVSRGRKLLEERESAGSPGPASSLSQVQKEKAAMMHEFELLGIRKGMASSEIREIDNKIANLHGMRKIIMERLAGLEQEEALLEHDIIDTEGRLEVAQALADEAEAVARNIPTKDEVDLVGDADDHDPEFMSQSVYEKLPSSANSTPSKRPKKVHRRKSMPILHEHFEAGSNIRQIRAHKDTVTALDFDAPFGTMVSAALDDTVKVWDLNAGRCIGILEGHTASVRTLQVEDNILATGSADATIRLWDLSRSSYDPYGNSYGKGEEEDEDAIAFENPDDQPVDPPAGSMDDCGLYSLEAHVDEVTALHFRGDVLVSGSADKTIRHWDLEKGRCVQTLDVMWAAAQASVSSSTADGGWRPTGRSSSSSADFVGALQVFESALACGTADGLVRLWDLRSGQVHRNLVGHTGAVTCLQFDDVHLVTGSLDRSVRIWDLRTGAIFDAYAYDNPITSMMFDTRRIVSAAGEDVVKVYDKVEGRQWDCGAGISEADEGKTPAVVEHSKQGPRQVSQGNNCETLNYAMNNTLTELLSWYSDATNKLINAPYQTGHQAPPDDDGSAVNDLLRRQAIAQLKIHDALVQGAPTSHAANESLLQQRLEDAASICMAKFYAYRYDLLPRHWRQIYTDTLILSTFHEILRSPLRRAQSARSDWLEDGVLDKIVKMLDRALITAGGAGVLGAVWIEKTLKLLERLDCEAKRDLGTAGPPSKRMKIDDVQKQLFTCEEPYGRPALSKQRMCPRRKGWSLDTFETYMNASTHPRPVIFTDLIDTWPAMTDHPWKSPDYLLSQTFGGRRLVPVEVGRSYVDDGWGQEIIPFKEFLAKYVNPSSSSGSSSSSSKIRQVGYLAQHNLFHQIPALRNDIAIPDLCWSSVPGHPTDTTKNQASLDIPQLNAWFGPARTITPLHTDGYHNLLTQVVGTKYVRLYAPWAEGMRPRGVEDGVDMGNTSALDVGVLEGWDEADAEGGTAEDVDRMKKDLEDAECWECILGEGDTLLIPMGWWHYVRSLSVSFSVSFWWN
ncbi:Mitochondrial fission protein [Conoideocrella luteorostrata]|uniref:Mitochondrial division protein 1 n=1 Tax=Conoideocrella luteorostrata TaxID=1105319 RepID=A0AAJ0CZE0_9HYPO|nr:Mitochondrial fission protein [Conoideocrella luteorostrata]